MKAFVKVISILLLLCIFMVGCTKEPAEKTIIESENDIPISSSVSIEIEDERTMPTYEFSVKVASNRELTISLQLTDSAEDQYTTEVTEVKIYDEDSLLQTITKNDIPDVTDYDWDGLFLNESNEVGLPDVRDLNFDGAEDFGLLAVSAYPQNVPYSYFLWNADNELFEYQFTAFGPGWLQVDEAEKCLVEISTSGAETYEKVFKFDPTISEIQNAKSRESLTTWQKAYLQIIQNLPECLVDSENRDQHEEYGYLGIHDFDEDGTPELIAGDLVSLAVFTFTDGQTKKLAELFYPDIVWCVNGVRFNGRSIRAQCDGSGGSSFVSFGYLDGQYVLGMYSETYYPNTVIINGEESSLEQMNQIYNINSDENDSGKSMQRVRRYFDGGSWQIQTLNGEVYTLDESFDFELIRWK